MIKRIDDLQKKIKSLNEIVHSLNRAQYLLKFNCLDDSSIKDLIKKINDEKNSFEKEMKSIQDTCKHDHWERGPHHSVFCCHCDKEL